MDYAIASTQCDIIQEYPECIYEFEIIKNEYPYHYVYVKVFEEELYPVETPYVRMEKKVGRNDPCPCGSGKKYKKCCGK